MKNGNESAYPTEKLIDGGHPMLGDVKVKTTGLTKREYFAGLAMQGMISGRRNSINMYKSSDLVKNSLEYADELLKQLENETTK